MPTATLDDLRAAVLQHDLLDEPARVAFTELAASWTGSPADLAKDMVRRGWLTHYQSQKLAKGKAGELILGQYLLLEPLGEGTMGQVFKARHRLMHRLVALKIIRRELLTNPKVVQRFHREVRAAAQLNHPNIVAAHDADLSAGRGYYVMEFVDGIDLGALVEQHGPLAVPQACDLIRQAALGLQHAHEKGLVHRDIKPQNLLLSAASSPQSAFSGLLKILDLGLARFQAHTAKTRLTLLDAMVGTPAFMAPEQAADAHHADIRADLYSLGCTLFFLLTGQPPFNGGSVAQVLFLHKETPAPDIRQFQPAVPAGLAHLLQKLLAKKPEERCQTPAEVARALLPFGSRVTVAVLSPASHFASHAIPTSTPGLAPTGTPIGASSPRWLAWSAGLGGVLACLLFLWVIWPQSQPEAAPELALDQPKEKSSKVSTVEDKKDPPRADMKKEESTAVAKKVEPKEPGKTPDPMIAKEPDLTLADLLDEINALPSPYLAKPFMKADLSAPDALRLTDVVRGKPTDALRLLKVSKETLPLPWAYLEAEKTLATIPRTWRRVLHAPVDLAAKKQFLFLRQQLAEHLQAVSELAKEFKKLEPQRASQSELRWQAHFDLAYARVLAQVIFLTECQHVYAQVTADALPLLGKEDAGWELNAATKFTAKNELHEVLADWQRLTTRLRQDFAKTPWADVAAKEVIQPMGLEWLPVKGPAKVIANPGKLPADLPGAMARVAEQLRQGKPGLADQDAALIAKKVPKDTAFKEIMFLFHTRKKGGLGVGASPLSIVPDGIELKINNLAGTPLKPQPIAKETLAKEGDDLEKMAYQTAAILLVAKNVVPKNGGGKRTPENWTRVAKEAVDASLSLGNLTNKRAPLGIQNACRVLQQKCAQCHDLFRN